MNDATQQLSSLYDKFNADVQLLLEKEPLWRVCSTCPDGHCCRRETVPVMGLEWDNIIRYLKSSFTKANKRIFQTNVDKGGLPCPFLIHDRCSVYSVRPWSCRIYPYTISFHTSLITSQSGTFYAPYCPTLAFPTGGKIGQLISYQPDVLNRLPDSRLVNVQINQNQSFWLIDITSYQSEYETFMPKNEYGTLFGDDMHKWVGLIKYLRDTGKIDQSKFLESLGLD